jgi:hypothetical protein
VQPGRVIGVSALALTLLVACEQGGGISGGEPRGPRTTGEDSPAAAPRLSAPERPRAAPGRVPAQARGNTAAGATFANWVMSTDPERRYLLDAFVRDDRVLGVVVRPTMTRGQVDEALRSLLSAMSKTFPGRAIEAIAYFESGDQLARLAWNPGQREAQTQWRR